MRTTVQNTSTILLVICLLTVLPTFAQTGGQYDLSWSTIDGGGGRF